MLLSTLLSTRWMRALSTGLLLGSTCLAGAAEDPVTATASKGGYGDHPGASLFIEKMVEQGEDRDFVSGLVLDARPQQSILDAISRPAEKRLDWGGYSRIFLGQSRIDQGVEFWDTHEDALLRASAYYGVAPEVIVAIIGVETRYGRQAGSYRVIDALATLAFDYPPRSAFFTTQLGEFIQLVQEQNLDPGTIKGSYAGAMGYGQFIPSSYRHYAVDFDQDGRADILSNPVDAIGSVANYFNKHGWRTAEPVALPASLDRTVDADLLSRSLKPVETLAHWRNLGIKVDPTVANEAVATALQLSSAEGDEYWLGLHNFYVITRYNHSSLYAMAVYQLSQAISEQRMAQAPMAENPVTEKPVAENNADEKKGA
ncbi:MAG: membrane-bound lytic murein transglycosylase B [Motiliproteus sp.]|jgi:membrane-bound lytic murein transglycosylase B